MKKLIAAALVGTMVLSMAGCGSKKAETTGSEASSDILGRSGGIDDLHVVIRTKL